MSEYQVIARKYRPQRFSDVVGQDHVVETLRNAIRGNRTAHAYLFVGPRGVGKTTLARIFAKALNCEHPEDGEPCCKCASCRAIAAENSLDVIEIDAASHNGAGEMRELAEEVLHMPVASRYKIYIIDEVHMLSSAAWNALLKTVEEPPAHVKFIFATTEVHKVLATIISRCQRFDLMPIPTRVIAERLSSIAANEKIAIEPAAIAAIARAADGGMRDAQSLLDQMFAFFSGDAGKSIDAKQVLELFGLTDRADLDALLGALLGNDASALVRLVHKLGSRGKNLETLFDDALYALRAVQLCMLLGREADNVLDEPAETVAHYRELASQANPDVVAVLMETLAPVGRILHDALNKQVFLETIFLKAMREAHAVKIADLLARLNQLRAAGELKFLDRLPPAQTPPAQTAPPPAPEAPPEADQSTVAPRISEGASADTPASAEKTPRERFAELIEAARSEFSTELAGLLALGDAGGGEQGVLRIVYSGTVDPTQFEVLERNAGAINALYRNLCGELACSVKLERRVEHEANLPAPVAVEAPPVPQDIEPDTEPEVAPNPILAEAAAAAVQEEEEVPAHAVGLSVMNDPEERAAAAADPEVRNILKIFGGEIADIHIDRKGKA